MTKKSSSSSSAGRRAENGSGEAVFFAAPAAFRAWLRKHHASTDELWVGYHRKGSGEPSMTWPESVDEALCYGWIDGLRKSIDATRYRIRFTPRRRNSIWSAVNIGRIAVLEAEGRMRPAGRAVFEARDEKKTNLYSFEREAAVFDPALRRMLEKKRRALAFFEAQPPSYRKVVTHWVMSAKKEETRLKRMRTLVDDSAAGFRIAQLRR